MNSAYTAAPVIDSLQRTMPPSNSIFQDYIDFKGQVDAVRQARAVAPPSTHLFTPSRASLDPRQERLYQVLIIAPSVVGFFHGYALQSFLVTFKWWLAGSLLAGLVSIPSWPIFRRDTVPWQPLPADDDEAEAEEGEAAAAAAAEEEERAAAASAAAKGAADKKGGGAKKRK